MPLDQAFIQFQLAQLGLSGQDIAVHASLRSFGQVIGGAQAVVDALLGLGGTVLMPAFCSIGRTNPPEGDNPDQNAWENQATGNQSEAIQSFDPMDFDCAAALDVAEMGQISATLLQQPGTLRSMHPSVSWAANGARAAFYTADHTPADPNQPLKRLVQKQGQLVLLGVSLSACTAVHLGEELAGRRPFIRWVHYADNKVRRIREYGCSQGFARLAPFVETMAKRIRIGNCEVVSYPIWPFVTAIAKVLAAQPEVTLCGAPACRCLASAHGGPIG